MTNVFSVPNKDVYLDINVSEEEDADTILLSIVFDDGAGGGRTEQVRVDPADLARELITASPAFANAIGEIAKAILEYFVEKDFVEDGDQAELA